MIFLKAVAYWLGRNSARSFFPLHALNVSFSIIQISSSSCATFN